MENRSGVICGSLTLLPRIISTNTLSDGFIFDRVLLSKFFNNSSDKLLLVKDIRMMFEPIKSAKLNDNKLL